MNYEFLLFVVFTLAGLFYIIPDVWKSLVSDFLLISDIDKWSIIKKERYNKHFYWSFLICFTLQTSMSVLHIMQFHTHEWYESLFLMTLGLFLINAGREGYLQYKGGQDLNRDWNVPFSWGDIRFGTYGGFIGSAISSIILSFL